MYNYFSPITAIRFIEDNRIMVKRNVELDGRFTYYHAYERCDISEYKPFSTIIRLDDHSAAYKPIRNHELALVHVKAAFPEMNTDEVNGSNLSVVYTAVLREWLEVNNPDELKD